MMKSWIISVSPKANEKWGLVFFVVVLEGSYYVAQTGLKLLILLPQPSKWWGKKLAPPFPADKCSYKRQKLKAL
jgi:hypothetical protein